MGGRVVFVCALLPCLFVVLYVLCFVVGSHFEVTVTCRDTWDTVFLRPS